MKFLISVAFLLISIASTSKSKSIMEDICTLPSDIGPCKSYIVLFYYDSSKGLCLPFVYGGCQGNANRFDTLEECVRVARVCGQVPEPVPWSLSQPEINIF